MIDKFYGVIWYLYPLVALLVILCAIWSLVYCCVQKPKWPFLLAAVGGYAVLYITWNWTVAVIGIPLAVGLASCLKKPRCRGIGAAIGGLIGLLFGLCIAYHDWMVPRLTVTADDLRNESFVWTLFYSTDSKDFLVFIVLLSIISAIAGSEAGLRFSWRAQKESEKTSRTP